MTVRYLGSGPYCYANSLAMVLGAQAPPPSALEVLTGSPFGVTFIAGLPFFSPAGWDPGLALDPAIAALGWSCDRTSGGEPAAAIARLREACGSGPVLAGPVEFGLLRYLPGMGAPVGSDHFVVVLDVTATTVTVHDPHGHPYATLPVDDFAAAWRADTVPYPAAPFTMRAAFRRLHDVTVETALRRSLPAAVRRLTSATGTTVHHLADLVAAGPDEQTHHHLTHFAVRVGARRLADAAHWLAVLGHAAAATIAAEQARLIGSLQYDLVAGDHRAAAATLRTLAPTYAALRTALATIPEPATPAAPAPR